MSTQMPVFWGLRNRTPSFNISSVSCYEVYFSSLCISLNECTSTIFICVVSFVLLSFTLSKLELYLIFFLSLCIILPWQGASGSYLKATKHRWEFYVGACLLKTNGRVLKSFSYFLSCFYQVFRKWLKGKDHGPICHRSRPLQFCICRVWPGIPLAMASLACMWQKQITGRLSLGLEIPTSGSLAW